jgi:hypothetical protein
VLMDFWHISPLIVTKTKYRLLLLKAIQWGYPGSDEQRLLS